MLKRTDFMRVWWAIFLWGSMAHGQAQAQAQTPSLQVLLRQTLAVHPTQQAKRALVAAARSGIDAVEAQRYPTFSATLTPNSAQVLGQANGGGRAAVTQPLWTFGLQDARMAVAQSSEVLARLDEWRTARQLLEQTALVYANALGLQKQHKISAANLETLEALRQKIVRRQQGQMASDSDVRLIGSRLAQARVQHERLGLDLGRALEQLRTLSQQPVEQVAEASADLLAFGATPIQDVLVQAQSPELQYQLQAVTLARSELRQLSASARPNLFAQVVRPLNGGITTHGVFLEASLEGGGAVLKGRLAAAEAKAQAADDEAAAIRNQLLGTWRELTLQYPVLSRNQLQLQWSLENARLTFESYLRQYEAGYKSWLEVMNMQRELYEQQLGLAQHEAQSLSLNLRLGALAGQLEPLAGWTLPIQGP